jgi:hypothetical protein
MGVKITSHGNFNKTESWLKRLLERSYLKKLDKYGKMGVDALRRATPVDTGLAASSWHYQVIVDGDSGKLTWYNDDIEGGCTVVVLVDRGHATKSGGWVAGKHFIEPALDPIMKKLEDEVWEEVTRV